MKTLILTLLLSLTVSDFALANRSLIEAPFYRGKGRERGNERSERVSRIGLGKLKFGGPGCPAGTVSLAMAPDNLSFSLLFDNFVVEAGGAARSKTSALCKIVVPFEIPQGMQMEITRVDFRGFVDVPRGGMVLVQSSMGFLEQQFGESRHMEGERIMVSYKFDRPVTENYELSSDLLSKHRRGKPRGISRCGGVSDLHIDNVLVAHAGARGAAAMGTIDSIDGAGNAIYHVNWKRCSDGQNPGRPPFGREMP